MQKLSKKFLKVMQECRHIQKSGVNSFHGYSYATSADVMEKVNNALTSNNIIPDCTKLNRREKPPLDFAKCACVAPAKLNLRKLDFVKRVSQSAAVPEGGMGARGKRTAGPQRCGVPLNGRAGGRRLIWERI